MGRGGGGVNSLTVSANCPQSRQPELKHAAVRIAPAALSWQLNCRVWLPADQALALREQLRPLLQGLSYAACVPFGREADLPSATADELWAAQPAGESAQSTLAAASDVSPHTAPGAARLGLMLRAAHTEAPSVELLGELRRLLGLEGAEVLSYSDPRRGDQKVLKLLRLPHDGGQQARHALVGCWWIKPMAIAASSAESTPTATTRGAAKVQADASDACLTTWRTWLDDATPLNAGARELLAPSVVTRAPRSRQVCTCFDVDEASIVEKLQSCTGDPVQRLASLQGELRCGSNCGSCLSALRALVASTSCRDVVMLA
jgi:assimilatory nitrate reductase catalytic subunit